MRILITWTLVAYIVLSQVPYSNAKYQLKAEMPQLSFPRPRNNRDFQSKSQLLHRILTFPISNNKLRILLKERSSLKESRLVLQAELLQVLPLPSTERTKRWKSSKPATREWWMIWRGESQLPSSLVPVLKSSLLIIILPLMPLAILRIRPPHRLGRLPRQNFLVWEWAATLLI